MTCDRFVPFLNDPLDVGRFGGGLGLGLRGGRGRGLGRRWLAPAPSCREDRQGRGDDERGDALEMSETWGDFSGGGRQGRWGGRGEEGESTGRWQECNRPVTSEITGAATRILQRTRCRV